MEKSKLGIGVIGCGTISDVYLTNITQHYDNLELLAVADIYIEKAQQTAKKYGVPKACSVEELLAMEDIKLVLNLTTPGVHYYINEQILNAGKHVYCEKPLTLSLEEGKKLAELAEKKNLLCVSKRIATDTSQKISVRYGETIRAYMRDPERELSSLRFIPLAIAGWCRYLLGVDDELKKMELSPDPMLEPLRAILREVQAGRPETYRGQLRPVLANPVIMGTDLTKTCLSDKIETLFQQMLEGEGAVRRVLDEETL